MKFTQQILIGSLMSLIVASSAYGAQTFDAYFFTANSVYTTGWLNYGGCTISSFVVVTSGSSVPTPLAANTAYLIKQGSYPISSTVSFAGGCAVLLGLGDVRFTGGVNLVNTNIKAGLVIENLMLSGNGAAVDGLTVNGAGNVTVYGIQSTLNQNGLRFLNTSGVNGYNLQTFANTSDGVLVAGSSGLRIRDAQSYSNASDGFEISTTSMGNVFHKIQAFGNTNYGVRFLGTKGVFNNVAVFNNGLDGVNYDGQVTAFNGIQAFNNGANGVSLGLSADAIYLNSGLLLNNLSAGLDTASAAGANSRYYGTIRSFANGSADDLSSIVTGSAADTTGTAAGWSNGLFDAAAGTMDCTYAIVPNNGIDMISSPCTTRGAISSRVNTSPLSYTFGANVLVQAPPVMFFGGSVSPNGRSFAGQVGQSSPIYLDTTPNAFGFASQTCQSTGTIITSTTITLGGLNRATAIFVTGDTTAQFSVNGAGGPFGTTPMIVDNGDTVTVRVTSPIATGATATGTVVVGGYQSDFIVATAPNCTPVVVGGGNSPVCGNGIYESTEECDDGNLMNGDGCSDVCRKEPPGVCGNGVLEYTEQCDDGNMLDGDGCSSMCLINQSLFGTGIEVFTGQLGVKGESASGYASRSVALEDTLRWYDQLAQACQYYDADYYSIQFTDINKSVYQQSVETLLNYCIVQGKGQNITTKPFGVNDSALRSEFIKVAVKTFLLGRTYDVHKVSPITAFKDMPTTPVWFTPFVALAEHFSLVEPRTSYQEDGVFLSPYETVSTSDAVQLLSFVLRSTGKSPQLIEREAQQLDPQGTLTRGQMAKLFQVAYGLRHDLGIIMKSKNRQFFKFLSDATKDLSPSQREQLLQVLPERVEKLPQSVFSRYGLYKSGLVQDLKRIAVGGLINELTYYSPEKLKSLNELLENKSIGFVPKTFQFTRAFYLGDTGKDVVVLQNLLKGLGYYQGESAGEFDIQTRDALYYLQIDYGILDRWNNPGLRGVLGPATRKVLNELLIKNT